MRYATKCVQPAYEYFKAKFDDASGELKDSVLAFRAARYFVPAMVNELQPTTSDIDSLKLFPFFDANLIDKLEDELPTYLAAAEDVSPGVEVLSWLKNHQNEVPSSAVIRGRREGVFSFTKLF